MQRYTEASDQTLYAVYVIGRVLRTFLDKKYATSDIMEIETVISEVCYFTERTVVNFGTESFWKKVYFLL